MAKKNLLSGLSNAKTRTLVILFGAVIVIGVAIAVTRGKKEGADVLAKQGSQAASVPAQIKSTPGSNVSEQYRELQVAENDRRAQEAMKKKTSAIPTIIGAVSDTGVDKNSASNTGLDEGLKGLGFTGQGTKGDEANLLGGNGGAGGLGGVNSGLTSPAGMGGKSALEKEREAQEARIREQRERLDRMREEKERARLRDQELERQRRAAEAEKKAYEESVKKIEASMKGAAQVAYGDWVKLPTQQYVQGEHAKSKHTGPDVIVKEEHIIVKGTSATPSRFHKQILKKHKTFIKAGTVLYGVLDTAINSDEKGPILATIVSGKYSGSKLVGSLKDYPKPGPGNQMEGVVVQFSQMNIPKRTNSIGVNIVAIDTDTARTALATDVNHHYLMRYGSLFAASFISGYGKAVASSGATSTVSPLTGTVTTSQPPIDNKQIFEEALGELGTQWAEQIKPIFNTTAPTVTVDQGTSIGLLFLTDVDATDEG
jgi:intracellular multiplication protein IcmE